MSEAFFTFIKRAFDIRDGELSRASLMQLNIFLIITTLLIVKPTINGLFLSEMGVEALPGAFILVAFFAVLISTLYSRFLGNVPINKIIQGTLLASVTLFILFGFLLRLQVVGRFALYALYTWVAIFGVLTASQFWILANVVFNAREAKRLFGFIGAGAIAGGIFGGYLTTLLAETLGSENLPFLAAGFLFLCVPITAIIWRQNGLNTQSKFERRKKLSISKHPLKLILQSPHLTYLAAIIGLGVLVAKLVDYQFSAVASQLIEDPDELTAFFGFWFSNFNLISLAIQLLLTRRIVGNLGVGKALFFLPISILIGAVLIFFIPQLWAAIFIKTNEGSLKQSINKAAVELLALPVALELKKKTKTFIDLVVDSLATGLSGLILIFIVKGLDLSTKAISVMIVLLIIVWLYFVFKIRKSYLQSFLLNIQKPKQNIGEPLDLRNESVISGWKKIFEKGTESQILSALQKIKSQPDDRFSDVLLTLLSHPSDRIKEEAIRNLYFLKSKNYSTEVQAFTNHPNQQVKIAAFDYLIGKSPDQAVQIMEGYLSDTDYKVQAAALVSLAEESRGNQILKEKFQLEKLLKEKYEELASFPDQEALAVKKIGLIKAIGISKAANYYFVLDTFLKDENIAFSKQAVISAGHTMDAYFLPALIKCLSNPKLSENARKALVFYGPEIVNKLSAEVLVNEHSHQVLKQFTLIVEQFGLQSSADLLFKFLKNEDSRVRLSALRSLSRLKINHPYLNFYEKNILPLLFREAKLYQDTLSILYVQMKAEDALNLEQHDASIQHSRKRLIKLLEKKLDQGLERLFRLIGLKYNPEDVFSVYQNIHSTQPDLRSNAIDFLDNLLDSNLKKILMPIVETAMLDAISEEAIQGLNLKLPDEMECYEELLKGRDEEVIIAVKRILNQLKANN